jgi:hypothetical protein
MNVTEVLPETLNKSGCFCFFHAGRHSKSAIVNRNIVFFFFSNIERCLLDIFYSWLKSERKAEAFAFDQSHIS